MIVFKIESAEEKEINTAITEMKHVLAEIAPTLRILQDLLKKHADTISSPSIDTFRSDIVAMLPEAIHMAHHISTNSQILAGVSAQASKHLAAVETQARVSLVGNTESVVQRPVKSIEGTTNPGLFTEARSSKLFQKQANVV